MKTIIAAALAASFALPASAAIIDVNDVLSSAGLGAMIVAAPADISDNAAQADAMRGFNEKQGVTLAADLSVDGGVIAAGTLVNSHMIYLDRATNNRLTHGLGAAPVIWEFDGAILGVMSDSTGSFEAASNAELGALGTTYPGSFTARGFEGNDNYAISAMGANFLEVGMEVTEPGDWIRVVTSAAPIPLPAAGWMMIAALGGIALLGRKKA